MYEVSEEGILRTSRNGEEQLITNFTAEITHETKYTDGASNYTTLTVTGKIGKKKLPEITIPAERFASLGWVTTEWGIGPVISPLPNAERDVRAAIQYASKPKQEIVYTHTGWTKSKQPMFLTNRGAITKDGYKPNVKVSLPNELQRYALIPDETQNVAATNAILDMRKHVPHDIAWPLITTAIRPPIAPVDYAIHVSGRTGTYKSELASIIQSHYGEGMDARHLPGSWSSTANALEAQTYRAKNAIFVIDDFVPFGTSWQVRTYQKTADQIIRGQGNQAGRARLTDVSKLQETMYPRGMIFSTGEDIPTGHSIRARMMIIELSPGDIKPPALTTMQNNRPLYPIGIANWIAWIAKRGPVATRREHKTKSLAYRKKYLDIGHSRTPAMLADMIAAIELYIQFAKETKAISKKQATPLFNNAIEALKSIAAEQQQHLTIADPTDVFISTLRLIFNANTAHIRTLDGGIPQQAENWGWTSQESQLGGITTYTAHGQKIGWIDYDQQSILLEPNVVYPIVTKNARGGINCTKQTLYKRLKDAGLLNRADENRNRNTIRVTAEGRIRSVLSVAIPTITESQETE